MFVSNLCVQLGFL